MTDLLTPPMPAELRDRLDEANDDLHRTAENVFEFLGRFFEDAWAECHRVHTVRSFKLEKGERVKITVEYPGTPDFNEFDRHVGKYAKAVSKLRSMLWDIDKAAKDGAGVVRPGRVTEGATPTPSSSSQAATSQGDAS